MATLVGSGLPVEEALGAVARQADRARLGGMMLAVRARVLEGHTLATALSDFPQVFPELYRATVAAGEQSGHLEVVFERLADYTEARQQMRQKVGLALFYPLMLTGVAILVVAGLLTYVVPQVVQVFGSLNQQLPALTRGLIALSEFLRQNGWWLLAILAGALSLGCLRCAVLASGAESIKPCCGYRWWRAWHGGLTLLGLPGPSVSSWPAVCRCWRHCGSPHRF
jgi:general secretion pathway protein F